MSPKTPSKLEKVLRAGHLAEVPAIVDFLQRYALEHFATEEREMAAAGYPGLAAHARLHSGSSTTSCATRRC